MKKSKLDIDNTSLVLRPVESLWPTREGDIRLALVGEAPGADEVLGRAPFLGAAGQLLNKALRETGIDRDACFIGNIFRYKPKQNKIETFFLKKIAVKKLVGWTPALPAFESRGVANPDREADLKLLASQLTEFNPDIVVALGATALWGLTGLTKISAYRGIPMMTAPHFPSGRPLKLVATYHPSNILRGQWAHRPVLYADLVKAKREALSPEITLTRSTIWTNPTLTDLDEFYSAYVAPLKNAEAPLAFDIETRDDIITCIGFAASKHEAIVVPFYDNGNYWPSPEMEAKAWAWVAKILEDPTITKLAQNITYDAAWLKHYMGISIRGPFHDTMHAHHALQPELDKKLSFLASLYTTGRDAWKTMISFKGNKVDA